MKKLIFLSLMIVAQILICNTVSAQTLRNALGARIGEIESSGIVRDELGKRLGEISSDGIVRNELGQRTGEFSKEGTVRDNSVGESVKSQMTERCVMLRGNR